MVTSGTLAVRGSGSIVNITSIASIVPNAGADAITGPMCAPNILRSSFTNWQPGYSTGVVAAQRGHKRAMTITWNYAAFHQVANDLSACRAAVRGIADATHQRK